MIVVTSSMQESRGASDLIIIMNKTKKRSGPSPLLIRAVPERMYSFPQETFPYQCNETQNLALMPMGVQYALINLGEWKVTGCELQYRSELAATKGGRAPLPAPVSDDEGRARQSPTPPFEGRGSHCRRSLTSLTPSAAAGVRLRVVGRLWSRP